MRVLPLGPGAVKDGLAVLKGADARHIRNVLRMGAGDTLKVSCHDSRLYEARIRAADENAVTIELLKELGAAPSLKPDVTLAFCISRQDVMELVVQKAVELDCAGFVPVIAGRSVPKTLTPTKMERLRRIAHEACKQCGRISPMPITEPVDFSDIPHAELKILLWEMEKKQTVKGALERHGRPESVVILVGPRGGIGGSEAAELEGAGFVPAGMGGLILRAETAAIAILSIVNYHYGKF